MKLRFTTRAARQIDDALDYIETESVQGAKRVRERLQSALRLIQDHPLSGQKTSRSGLRRIVLTPFPYVFYYRISQDAVIVSRFRHTSRKP